MPITKLDQLKNITKLSKLHPHFGSNHRLDINDPIVDEITRITGCVSTKDMYIDFDGWIADAKTLSEKHNVPIVLNSSPMHWFKEPDHVALVKNLDAPVNKAVNRELKAFHKRCEEVKNLLDGSGPKIVLLDCEQFLAWNISDDKKKNLQERYDLIYGIPKTIFGDDTEVWWYNFAPGQMTYQNGDNWSDNEGYIHGVGEKTEGTAFSHYYPTEIPALLEGVYHTSIWPGREHLPMSVWVSLGSGYKRPNRPDKNPWHHHDGYVNDLVYEHYYSWWAGLILNAPWGLGDRYMDPLTKVKMVNFYPGALDTHTPKWLDHFISYCHGAMRKKTDWTPADS